MTTGRILQFDHVRGYGFVAADDGGEDVFLHSSVFDGDADELAPGMLVEFKVMAGDRGRKAFAAHLVADDAEPAPQPQPGPAQKPGPALPLVAPPIAVKPLPGPHEPDEEPMCDVLSPEELSRELTELLVSSVPDLTGQQILNIRHTMLAFAKNHGWSDG